MEEQTKIGQYILVRKIGEGGMAEVWEANHIHLGHRAAIKFLLPEFARNQDLQERFLNEGKRQAQLQHPNIVPATDFFQLDGRSFLVMQYVEGENLESRLNTENPPLTSEDIHSISWDVLSALDYAHSLGVIHRDVKPSNMLVDRNGRVLLMDFGIALALSEETRVTRTGTSMGTPDYMSPEQITQPKEVGARSDIYSFGCVLYAMLSGNPPFTIAGATPFLIQDRQVRADPPPLVYRNPDIPRAVGDVASRCLEKNPANRYQSCREVMAALEKAISPPTVVPPPPSPPTPAPLPPPSPPPTLKYAAIGLAAVLVISGLVYFAMTRKTSASPDSVSQPVRVVPKDLTNVRYNDPELANCQKFQNSQACLDKKAEADKLHAVSDWQKVPESSPLLKDCMGLPACLDREATLAQETVAKSKKPSPHQPGSASALKIEDLPASCAKSSNPAACKALKKSEGIPDGSIYGP